MRSLSIFPALLAVPLIAGCASFNSMPNPVVTVRATDAMLKGISVREAIDGLAGIPDEGQRKTYRNKVIASYLAAADARYINFLQHLSRQTKASNFGLDVAALGLSSVAAIAKSAANELSTAAAIAGGTRGSLNKEVYFDKAMPALVSSMEARRLEVRAQIETRMRDENTPAYTLEQGFADVMRYQMATTLDGAIQEITSSAGEKETEAQEAYENAVESCAPARELAPVWGQINDRLYDLADAGKADTLALVAAAVGAAKKEGIRDQARAITIAARGKCKLSEAQAILALIPAE